MNDYKGYISTEHTLWCGGCPRWDQMAIPTKRGMAIEGKRKGWTRTKEHGWLCPSCSRDKKNGTLT